MAPIVLQDACVLVNLLAGGRFEDMAAGCGFRFAIASVVAREALFLRDDSGERQEINLQAVMQRGILEILGMESQAEKQRFIDLALDLDDGEAESVAIAEARGLALATDDRKARNVIQRRGLKIQLWSTCGLLRGWQIASSVSDAELGGILRSIARRAKYRPKPGHPDFEWWTTLASK